MSGAVSAEDIKRRLWNIDPYDFEHFVGDLWKFQGWDAEVSQASNDMGVDVVAERTDGLTTSRQAIQVKRYSDGNKIGRDDVQQYYALKVQDSQADSAAIVTTSSFTSPAEEWASEHNVKLIDGDDLADILLENDALHILDDYAPTLREDDLDPAFEEPEEIETDELGVDIEGEEDVDLPNCLDDDDSRKKIAGVGAVAGLLMILNPTSISLPIEALGMLVLLAGIGVALAPETIWDAVTPTREVYREFGHGGLVALDGGDIQYEPPGDGSSPRVFENETDERARQRAAVYGALHNYLGGDLRETDKGMLPTSITNEGGRIIAAYRFAVHDEDPEQIASEMSMSQQEVIDHLRSVVS